MISSLSVAIIVPCPKCHGPIEKKLVDLREKYKDNEKALMILEIEQREIDLFRKYSQYYSYVFYVGQRI
jgi:hypothetical protein